MKKILMAIVCLAFLCPKVHSQHSNDELKKKIISMSADFIYSDKTILGNGHSYSEKHVDVSGKKMEELISYINSKTKVPNIDGVLNDIDAKLDEFFKSPQNYQKVANEIYERSLNGKNYRKEGDFETPSKDLKEKILNTLKEYNDKIEAEAAKLKVEKDNAEKGKKKTAVDVSDDSDSSSGGSLGLILAILAIGLAAASLYFSIKKNKPQTANPAPIVEDNPKWNDIIRGLESKQKELNDRLNRAELNVNDLHSKIASLSTQKVERYEQAAVSSEQPKNNLKFFYASYADEGKAFSVDYLKTQADHKTIFEIAASSPSEATFKVYPTEAAYKIALNDPAYLLGEICDYANMPETGKAIKTLTPGQLKFDGNKWVLVSKAVIQFV